MIFLVPTPMAPTKQSATFTSLQPERLQDPFTPYSTDNITKKNGNKNVLLELLGKDVDGGQMLVGLVLSKKLEQMEQEERDLFEGLLEALQAFQGTYPVLIGLEEDAALSKITKAPSFILGTHANADQAILSGMDTFLFVEKSPRLEDLGKLLVQFGSGIITYKAKTLPSFLEEYNQYKERGNALLFTQYDVWNAFATVVRLKEIASFPYDWNTFRRVAMQSVR